MSSHSSQDSPTRGRSRGRGHGRGQGRGRGQGCGQSRARSRAESMNNIDQACDADRTLRTLSTRARSYVSYFPMPTRYSEAASQSEPVDKDLDPGHIVSAEYLPASTVASGTSTLSILLFHDNIAPMNDATTGESYEPRTSVSAEATTVNPDPSTSPSTRQFTSPTSPQQGNLDDVATQGNITDRNTSPRTYLGELATSIQRNIDGHTTHDNINDQTIPSQSKLDDQISQGNINRHITQDDIQEQTTLSQSNRDDLSSPFQRHTNDVTSFPQSNLAYSTFSNQGNSNNRTFASQRDLNEADSSQGNSNNSSASFKIRLDDLTSSPLQTYPHILPYVPQSNVDNPTLIPTFSPQINPNETVSSAPSQRSLSELCNPSTVDFAFEFTVPSTHGRLGLWAHQSVLVSTPGAFTSLFGLPNIPDTASTCLRRFYESRVLVPEFSLVAHCALLHFLYTAEEEEMPDQIDLRDFVITPIPVLPWMVDDIVDMVLEPVYATPWTELLVLARRYHLDNTLGVLCQDKIVASLTFLDAVPTLLVHGGDYPEMKARILNWCGRTVLRVYNALSDPARGTDSAMLRAILAGLFERVEGWEGVTEACEEISREMLRATRQRGCS
ncbi:hypothetical protein BGZ82_005285 [Podila clonocystis]|nr:hypothetical protein BGZ82_005285 [Podila clonocystis]